MSLTIIIAVALGFLVLDRLWPSNDLPRVRASRLALDWMQAIARVSLTLIAR